MSYLVKTHRSDRSSKISRFMPRYWTLDMPLEVSGSIRTTSSTAIRADAVFRRNGDIAGIMWHSDHPFDHPRFKYETKNNYTGLVWTFSISLGGDCPRLDALYGATLVIDTGDGKTYNVRLWNYRTDKNNSDPYKQKITIPFTSDLYSGYGEVTDETSDAEKEARRVPVTDIVRLMLPITPRDYLGGEATLGSPLASGTRTVTVQLNNGATLMGGDLITVPTSDGGGYELAIAGVTGEEGDPVAHGSDWGDVVFEWSAPEGFTSPTYEVSVKKPDGTWAVLGTTTETWFDFPVEDNVPIFDYSPSWIEWRVKVTSEMSYFVDAASAVAVDNSFVTVVVPFLGQSNAVGHFTELSGSGRDTCSAATFRRKLAELYGIRAVRVMPLEVCWGSSAADRQADDDPINGVNYWWDLNEDKPGPRLLQAVGIINSIGKVAPVGIWAQGENDVSYTDVGWSGHGNPQPTIDRMKQSWIKIFAYLRANTNPDMTLYIQKMCTSWYGDPPYQVLVSAYEAARAAQDDIATTDPLTYIGAQNLCFQPSDFLKQDITYIHYATTIYHQLANLLATSIHDNQMSLDGTGTAPGIGDVPAVYLTPPIVDNGGGSYTVRTTRAYLGPAVGSGTRVSVKTQLNVALASQNECWMAVEGIVVSGSNTTLKIDLRYEPAHSMSMTDGYDNCYNLTPEFVAERTWSLGYRGPYVLYMGISHFHNFDWTGERWLLRKTGSLVNSPTRLWFEDFCKQLQKRNYDLWVSISYEILQSIMPVEWAQVNVDGVMATTGWSPPSGLVEPSNSEAAAYLANVAIQFLGIAQDNGLVPRYQIGEPWWWDGSYTDNKPCVYSLATVTKYNEDTGLYAPAPYMESTHLTEAELEVQRPFLEWLGRQLGESTNTQIDIVKAAFPKAQTAILVFTPQVLNPTANASAIMNLPPADQWGPSKFNILMIEDYDWVTKDYDTEALGDDNWALMKGTWVMAQETLGYPLSRIFYFSGFNLSASTDWKWAYIDAAAEIGRKNGAAHVFFWSREQILRDGFIYQRRTTPTISIQTNARVT
ncbi:MULTISPECIES: hypothetical protein [unclassified Xanthobacter]|uniref:non-contractile tail sheath protein n=1 Tax=unclassified Xanthobacter TaxID=2623496 RepID=UPI001F2AD8C9|nr:MULTISPECIES: hypothetical protein [unclassified Xanthobacter]